MLRLRVSRMCTLRRSIGSNPPPRLLRPKPPWVLSRRGFANKVDYTKDYYGTLGLSPGKHKDSDIKKAYHALAKLYHPDANTNASEAKQKEAAKKFTAIQEAYEILSDKESRAEIDRHAVAERFRSGT